MDYTTLIETPEWGFALAGCTDSFRARGYDFWLIKTDEQGIVEWNQTYGLSNQDTNLSLVQT